MKNFTLLALLTVFVPINATTNEQTTLQTEISENETEKKLNIEDDISPEKDISSITNSEIIVSDTSNVSELLEDQSNPELEKIETPEKVEKFDVLNRSLLEGELPNMIAEFQDIMDNYNKGSRTVQGRISLYRRLLARLQAMKVNTPFLFGHVYLMRISLAHRLTLFAQAKKDLDYLFEHSSLVEVRDSAAKIWISLNYVSGDRASLQILKNEKYTQKISSEMSLFLDTMIRSAQKISTDDDVKYIVDHVLLAPDTSFQHPNFAYVVMSHNQDKITVDTWDYLISLRLYEGNTLNAVQAMKFRLKFDPQPSVNTLKYWGRTLVHYEKDLAQSVKALEENSTNYQAYTAYYEDKRKARSRGKVYYQSLHRYRGEQKNPYHAEKSYEIMKEYLSGSVEEEFLDNNAKLVFRNLLSVNGYDKIIELANLAHEKMGVNLISPYISYWLGFSYLELQDPEKAAQNFAYAIAESPDSYCGILAHTRLTQINQNSAVKKILANLKNDAESDLQNKLRYAHLMSYTQNNLKDQATKYLLDNGISFSFSPVKINAHNGNWLQSFADMKMWDEIRNKAYQLGAKTLYMQDNVLIDQFVKQENEKDLLSLLDQRNTMLKTKTTAQIGVKAMKQYYPKPYLQEMTTNLQNIEKQLQTTAEASLVYAVMRSESFYREKARSSAGARGLMQVMPATGKWLLERYKMDKNSSSYDPSVNIYLGARYLYENIAKMGLIPAVAGYNSGPNFVAKLREQYDVQHDTVLVEIHPKRETREYIKKVMTAYHRYIMLYDKYSIINVLQTVLPR